MPPTNSDESSRQRAVLVRFAGLGVEFAAGIVVFVLVGYWIDSKLDSAPIGVVTGALLGCVGGMYNLIRSSIRLSRTMSPPPRRPEPPDDEQRPQAPS
ncbi:MAG: AtpZ/AtpI family protein [Phycisphaerales bacterium]|nr:AtpZ/AtpI family protein [Phycisphaerales bacterium]